MRPYHRGINVSALRVCWESVIVPWPAVFVFAIGHWPLACPSLQPACLPACWPNTTQLLPQSGVADRKTFYINGEKNIQATDLEFVKKFTRPNLRAKEFYTLKTRKSRLFSPAINSENASLAQFWFKLNKVCKFLKVMKKVYIRVCVNLQNM